MKKMKQVVDACYSIQYFEKHQRIKLNWICVTVPDVSYLVHDTPVQRVKTLNFNLCYFYPAALQKLAQGNWQNLVNLIIEYCRQFTNQGCQQLCKIKCPNLQKISLKGNNISCDGIFPLTQADWPKICMIDLSQNKIQQKGCEYLQKSHWNLTQILICYKILIQRKICLVRKALEIQQMIAGLIQALLIQDDNIIGDKGCKWLSQSQLPHLQCLYLRQNQISKAGCRWLAKMNWNELHKVTLSVNALCWESWRCLSYCKWLKMQQLRAIMTLMEDEGALHLIKSVKNLRYIEISNNSILNKQNIAQMFMRFAPELDYIQMFMRFAPELDYIYT